MFEVQLGTPAEGKIVIGVVGEIDLATAPEVAGAVSEALATGTPEIVVDLSQVSFLDSSGIRALVESHHAANEAGARLSVRGAQSWVAKVLNITGVGALLAEPHEQSS
jgi:anti-anti-sigma factor